MGLLIFKQYRVHLRRTATRNALLDFTTIQPSIIQWVPGDIIIRTTHLMIDLQLFHEPFIWFAKRTRLPQKRQR